MHIFVDESGSFALNPPRSSVSHVGALVVPDHKIEKLFSKYRKLRPSLPKHKGEVKGRLLSEADVAKVVDIVFKNSGIFDVVAIDVGFESSVGVEDHRRRQANALTRHLTPQHHPNMIESVNDLRSRLEAMPLPLYIQSQVTIQLLGDIIRFMPAYWSLRVPKEVLNYHWVIDGKGVEGVTDAEDWWSVTMLGLLQSRSHRDPMVSPDWVDRSDFDAKFLMKTPDYLKEHWPGVEAAVNLRLLMKESFRFSSDPEPGLELVDIVTNATRRALIGNLGRSGWAGIPKLMIHSRDTQYIKLIALSDVEDAGRPYSKVMTRDFWRGGRSMLPPSVWREEIQKTPPKTPKGPRVA
jgi:hypothetical protein